MTVQGTIPPVQATASADKSATCDGMPPVWHRVSPHTSTIADGECKPDASSLASIVSVLRLVTRAGDGRTDLVLRTPLHSECGPALRTEHDVPAEACGMPSDEERKISNMQFGRSQGKAPRHTAVVISRATVSLGGKWATPTAIAIVTVRTSKSSVVTITDQRVR